VSSCLLPWCKYRGCCAAQISVVLKTILWPHCPHVTTRPHWIEQQCLGELWSLSPFQDRLMSVFSNHNYRICKDQLMYSRLRTPNPQKTYGLMTLSHTIKKLPPLASSRPFQTYPWCTLSTALMNHLGIPNTYDNHHIDRNCRIYKADPSHPTDHVHKRYFPTRQFVSNLLNRTRQHLVFMTMNLYRGVDKIGSRGQHKETQGF
jgi:hypothetical protein